MTARLHRLDEAALLLREISDEEERDAAAEVIARGYALAGRIDGIRAILEAIDDGRDRHDVLTGVAQAIAAGGQVGVLTRLGDVLTPYDGAEPSSRHTKPTGVAPPLW